jgi:DNA-binding XRE family transcriptional regulator
MLNDSRLYKLLGAKLKAAREHGPNGRMTQAELGLIVGLERTSITNIEKGTQKLPLHVLFRICEALSVSVLEVLPTPVELSSVGPAELSNTTVEFNGQAVPATPLVKQALESIFDS